MVSRSEGYKRSIGKEEKGLIVVEDFLGSIFSVTPKRITGKRNFEEGDLALPIGNIEVKSQPINPFKYRKNFVEVCEVTDSTKPHHKGGFQKLKSIINISSEQLASVKVCDMRKGIHSINRQLLFGKASYVSVSISNFANAKFCFYVNSSEENRFLYCYSSEWLLSEIRNVMLSEGVSRGAGMSNEDTFAVFTRIKIVWKYENNKWKFQGSEDLEELFMSTFTESMISS